MPLLFFYFFYLFLACTVLLAGSGPRELHTFQIGINCHQYDLRYIPWLNNLGVNSARVDITWALLTNEDMRIDPNKRNLKLLLDSPLYLTNTLAILSYGHPNYQSSARPKDNKSIDAFSQYCQDAVSHLARRTDFYEVWNEWDIIGMGSTPIQEGKGKPEDYVRLLSNCVPKIRAVNSRAFILAGAMSGIGKSDDFFIRLLKAGLLNYCDGISIHPYFFGDCNRFPEVALPSRINQVDNWLRIVPKNKKRPIFITELGWPTYDAKNGVSFSEQAKWLTRSLLVLSLNSNIKGVWIYELIDSKYDPNDKEANFGLLKWDGEPKPSYDCLRDIIWLFSKNKQIRRLNLADKSLSAVILSDQSSVKSMVVWGIYPGMFYKVRISQNSRTGTPRTIGRIEYPDGLVPVNPDGWFNVGDHPVLVTGVDEDFELLYKKQ